MSQVNLQCNVMRYRTGTPFNQKHAVRYNLSTNRSCSLCPNTDIALHILSGCQHTMIKNKITERHNITSRIIIEALNKGAYVANLVYTDVGSNTRFSDKGLDTTGVADSTLLPNLSELERSSSSHPDAIFILPAISCSTHFTGLNSAPSHFDSNQFDPRTWDVHLIEFKFCEDTRPEAQLTRAREQHSMLVSNLRKAELR